MRRKVTLEQFLGFLNDGGAIMIGLCAFAAFFICIGVVGFVARRGHRTIWPETRHADFDFIKHHNEISARITAEAESRN
jgi:hypothetical protein